MIQPVTINQQQYNKLSDDVMLLGRNAILKMNVALYSNSEEYGKISYHREIEYYDKTSNSNMFSMKRSYDYYLSIENFKPTPDYDREFIRIGLSEMMLVQQSLTKAIDWFVGPEFKGLYARRNNNIIITRKVDPIGIYGLPMGKYLLLEPTVIVFNNNEEDTGVRIYLSNSANFVEMTLNKYMGLVYTINNINLFGAAQNMINYLGRPAFGTNKFSYADQCPESKEGVVSRGTRTIQPQNKTSFFDKFEN